MDDFNENIPSVAGSSSMTNLTSEQCFTQQDLSLQKTVKNAEDAPKTSAHAGLESLNKRLGGLPSE